MKKWHSYKLSDVVRFNPSERLLKGEIAKKVPMDLLQPYTRGISGFEMASYTGGSKFRNGDTLMARITPCLENGKTAYVSMLDEDEVGFGSTEYIVFRNIEGITDNKFVYYFVTSPWFRDIAVKSMVGSSGRQRVQQAMLENLVVNLPPLAEQKQIAGILGALDDKIELNRCINDNLEEQAKALFKSWFVDSDRNEWVHYELGDITLITAGGDRPSKYTNKKTIECYVPIYSNGIDNEGLYGYTDVAKIHEESITISARGTIGYVCLRLEPYVPIVRLISIIPNKKELSAKYLYLWALTQNITGTGTTQQQLTVPIFRKTPISIPSDTKLKQFNSIADPLFSQIESNKKENIKLSTLRDTLLPKLMSGELSVEEVSLD
ncbi:restriction endonuclease subunit S [Alistipes onderdonkii]|nr:restriction endonuclease subunit S [Alistipes onderdonkii]KAA2682860.1 restriction endonuclease subunit S [Alistipes onderdonkii]KAA2689131.1 restriction endonuclease subunit S [Alistipes onderdonkii]KAA2803645.1 restriction endonuclease subunit S [Alistipes onderdonkii]KAA2848501.1 restriction endonuclease subunit S [Alistipes onderdonkii]